MSNGDPSGASSSVSIMTSHRRKPCHGRSIHVGGFTARAVLLLLSTTLLLHHEAVAFSAIRPVGRNTASLLHASRSAASSPARRRRRNSTVTTVQPVQPKTSTSPTKRKEAKLAMQKQQQQQVDAQMLQLLSDNFLYAETSSDRPRGRPACVPGAMNYQTVIQFRKDQQEAAKRVVGTVNGKQQTLSTTVPYTSGTTDVDEEWTTHLDQEQQKQQQPVVEKLGRARPRKDAKKKVVSKPPVAAAAKRNKKKQKGAKKQSRETVATAEPKKKRKRVVKNLPKPKPAEKRESKKRRMASTRGDPQHLQRYFLTELLTAKEEYSLGMKIQFMMKCEHVHEGLSANLERLPTIVEWAAACG